MSNLVLDGGWDTDNHGQIAPAAVITLQRNILDALNKAYPAWEGSWNLVIDTRGGVVTVRDFWFTQEMGFLLKIADIDPEMRKVRSMAGELFERYDIERKKHLDVVDALGNLQRDGIGRAKYEK